jgi:signal transduction histidine kinase
MMLARLFSMAGMRFMLLNLILALSIATLLAGTIYLLTVRVVEGEVQNTVEAELQGLAEQFERDGYAALVSAIRGRVGSGQIDAVYLLTDARGRRIAGNLAAWPPTIDADGRWQTLDLYRVDANEPTLVGLRAFVLPGDVRLMVGRDLSARAALARLITRSLFAVGLIAAAFTFIGGQLLSRFLMRRIATVSRTSRSIMEGDLSQRVPLKGSDDEFDGLARSLNEMLDRIETLMTSMRTVTDSIAHDLKRPLTRLRSGLELALRHTDAAQSDALAQALVDTDAVLKTLNALMDIARAEAGLGQEHLEALDLGALATTLGEFYQPLLEEKQVTLDMAVASGCYVLGHRELLSQAIANLLENASRYSPHGGKVTLTLAAVNGRAHLTIADQGPGIPGPERTRVLGRFVRLDGARSDDGSGLGLSLAAAVARLHGAQLRLEDNGPGLRVVLDVPGCSPPGP